jgi:hypothetical protein
MSCNHQGQVNDATNATVFCNTRLLYNDENNTLTVVMSEFYAKSSVIEAVKAMVHSFLCQRQQSLFELCIVPDSSL